jgi:hypothetical protein
LPFVTKEDRNRLLRDSHLGNLCLHG